MKRVSIPYRWQGKVKWFSVLVLAETPNFVIHRAIKRNWSAKAKDWGSISLDKSFEVSHRHTLSSAGRETRLEAALALAQRLEGMANWGFGSGIDPENVLAEVEIREEFERVNPGKSVRDISAAIGGEQRP